MREPRDDTDDENPPSILDRLRRGERTLYRVPVADHSITVNEFHSHVLGSTTGLFLSFLYLRGFGRVALLAALLLCTFALLGGPGGLGSLDRDDPRYQGVGLYTVTYEPWHYLGLFVPSSTTVLILASTVA